jgi:hypothetical protein
MTHRTSRHHTLRYKTARRVRLGREAGQLLLVLLLFVVLCGVCWALSGRPY